MVEAYVDTNVWFVARSVAEPTNAALIQQAAIGGLFTVVLSDALLDEVHRLFLKEMGKDLAGLQREFLLTLPNARIVPEEEWSASLKETRPLVDDPDDLPHLAAHLESGADLFVTLNRRLTRMRVKERVTFRSPRAFVEEDLEMEGLDTPRGM